MPDVQEITATDHRGIGEFIELPFRLYRETPQWVPPFRSELRRTLTRSHPFFRHSDAAFYLARRGGEPVGRVAVFENRRFNSCRDRREARFYYFECAEDGGAARALLGAARFVGGSAISRIGSPGRRDGL